MTSRNTTTNIKFQTMRQALYSCRITADTWFPKTVRDVVVSSNSFPEDAFNTKIYNNTCRNVWPQSAKGWLRHGHSHRCPAPEVPEMTVEDAAGILGVSKARVYAMVKDGVLQARKVGQSILVNTASVKERQSNPRRAGRPKKQVVA